LIAIPVGLAIAIGAAVISWRPFAYAVLCWAGLLLIACVYLLQEFARAQAPTGVLLVLFVAGFCAAGAGFLELAVLRRGPRTAATDA
jgi:drug/metabolite transporter (DMT)-like permease